MSNINLGHTQMTLLCARTVGDLLISFTRFEKLNRVMQVSEIKVAQDQYYVLITYKPSQIQ